MNSMQTDKINHSVEKSSITNTYIGVSSHIRWQCTNISYLEIGEKPGIFRLTYQLHSSLADCVRDVQTLK